MRYQQTFAWICLAGAVLGLGLAACGCVGARSGVWGYAQGLHILYPALGMGGIALISGTIWIVRALKSNNGLATRVGLSGLAIVMVLLGIPAHYALLAVTRPPIHDVSTDIGEAPDFLYTRPLRAHADTPDDYDGPQIVRYDGERMTVSLAQKYAYPDIKPIERLAGTTLQKEFIAKYFWRSLNAVNALGWQVAGYDIKSGRIEATQASLWFGVVSDIVIRVRPAGAIGVRVDIRAKSRTGQADRGFNAKLIRAFMRKLKDG